MKTDLVFLHSEPLTFQILNEDGETELVPAGNPNLQVDLQHKELLQILRSTEKKFKVGKQSLNLDDLKSVREDHPEIICISCKGQIDLEDQ